MKIVGKTDSGYLVEATECELARAAGFSSDYSQEWKQLKIESSSRYESDRLKIGTVIKIDDVHRYLETLIDRERTAQAGAKVLRELADMIDTGLPTVIIPPKPVAPSEITADALVKAS